MLVLLAKAPCRKLVAEHARRFVGPRAELRRLQLNRRMIAIRLLPTGVISARHAGRRSAEQRETYGENPSRTVHGARTSSRIDPVHSRPRPESLISPSPWIWSDEIVESMSANSVRWPWARGARGRVVGEVAPGFRVTRTGAHLGWNQQFRGPVPVDDGIPTDSPWA